MNADHEAIVPEVAGSTGRSTRLARTRIPVAVRRGRRMWLALLALGPIAGLGLIPAGRAQTFVNSDGGYPQARLIISGNTLYGAAAGGGSSGGGTVFAANTDGTGFTILHHFTYSDGINPHAGLTNSGDTLYGTAFQGGSSGNGSVFAVQTDGSGFMNLHSFTATPFGTNSDGMRPGAGLILSGNTLYGTTGGGGGGGRGAVFAVNTDGTGFTNLHSFSASTFDTNSDGAYPQGLVLKGSTLYGTAALGGSSGDGTVFAVNTDGSGFTILHTFSDDDGAYPYAGLVLSGDTLYGTTENGGGADNGTVFALNTDGSGFTNLHVFSANTYATNSDGAQPFGNLVLSGDTLYGTTEQAGSSGNGTVFALNTDGTGFTALHHFTATVGLPQLNGDGANPVAGVILSGTSLYGTTFQGGSSGDGTVFRINTDGTGFTNLHSFTTLLLPLPELQITLSGPYVVLTWPADSGGLQGTVYTPQVATNLVSPVAWTYLPFTSSIINGQHTVYLPATDTRFYRLTPLLPPCTGASDCPPGYSCVGGVCTYTGGGGGGGGGGLGGGGGGCGSCCGNGIGMGCGGFVTGPGGGPNVAHARLAKLPIVANPR